MKWSLVVVSLRPLFSVLPTAGTRLYGSQDVALNEKRAMLLQSWSHQWLNSDLTLPHVDSSSEKQTSGHKHESCGSSGTWTRRTSGTDLLVGYQMLTRTHVSSRCTRYLHLKLRCGRLRAKRPWTAVSLRGKQLWTQAGVDSSSYLSLGLCWVNFKLSCNTERGFLQL